ncbi:MAG: glycerate kinase [Bacteroidota bacterium]|nr:glycerate kinase [Bacteroidota bacterium]
MYTFVLAPDSFKESMTAIEACNAMESGIKAVFPEANVIAKPMADGGEGTTNAIVISQNGQFKTLEVVGPLGHPVEAKYGLINNGTVAIIELAEASGIQLVPIQQRNPLITTTYGTGMLMKDAIENGAKKIIIGLGGSATNDGGAGLAQALGVKLLDANNNEIGFGGGSLSNLVTIDNSDNLILKNNIEIEIASDVTNPFIGQKGASAIFGPQKGATPEMVTILDQNLGHFASKIKQASQIDVSNIPGAGAAGGTGGGLMGLFDAKMKKGIELVIEYSGLEEVIPQADFVFTGEGSMDLQTQYGKTPYGVLLLAKKHKKKVFAFAGKLSDHNNIYSCGFDAVFSIMQGVSTLENALYTGKDNLKRSVESVCKVIKSLKN